MKPKLYILILVAISFFAFSCKTAKKLYEKGKYDEAVEMAAKKLQKDPNDSKFLDILLSSYDYAVNDHESRIRSNSESSNELKWEWMYNEYASLQRMYDAIYKAPSVFNLVKPKDYSSYLVTYGEKAGNVRFDRGMKFMQRSNAPHIVDKQSFQNAYREFQAAQFFKPGDMDIIQKKNEAYEFAVTNIVILPTEQQYGFRYSSFNNTNRNFDDQLLRNLQFNSGNEFLKFYSDWDAAARNIRPDMIVDMQLATMNIGRYYDDKSKRRVSKEVVIKETVYKPDSVVKEFGKVYADIITTRRTMQADAMLRVNVRDANGGWLWSDNINSNFNWSTEFATFNGDERALSESDKQLVNRRQEQQPFEDEIIRCLMEEISNNALYRLKNYFSRF